MLAFRIEFVGKNLAIIRCDMDSDFTSLIEGLVKQRERMQHDIDSCDRDETVSRAVTKLRELRDRAEITRPSSEDERSR